MRRLSSGVVGTGEAGAVLDHSVFAADRVLLTSTKQHMGR